MRDYCTHLFIYNTLQELFNTTREEITCNGIAQYT